MSFCWNLSLNVIIQDFYQRTSAFQVKSPEIKASESVLAPIQNTCNGASWIQKKKFGCYDTPTPWQIWPWMMRMTGSKALFNRTVVFPVWTTRKSWKQFQLVKVILPLSLPTFCEHNGHTTKGEYKEGRTRRKCKVQEGPVEDRMLSTGVSFTGLSITIERVSSSCWILNRSIIDNMTLVGSS